jgi:hypothetical protein
MTTKDHDESGVEPLTCSDKPRLLLPSDSQTL